MPAWHFTDEITSGRLVVILAEFEASHLPTHAVYPSRRFLAPKVRAMIDYFAKEFDREPELQPEHS